MPTECERSVTSPTAAAGTASAGAVASAALIASEIQSSHLANEELTLQQTSAMEDDMSTSQTSTTSNGSSCNGGRKTSITSPDPTAYVAKARVTRPTPPPPPYNPMQFVQIKPCNLYQTAQEQLKKAEEVKKIKEIRKEEPEDWQNNLDNWKSSRRKRVEHIIDRVVEVKKLELEEHDRTRRKSKTFSEMIEDRGDRVGRPALKKLVSLAVYTEDESNDLSDLGIGTSSASGKSSLSEDYDNNSVMSDNAAELDKAISNSNHKPLTDSTTREYISSPGYETSSSTAPASSPDPCEYTYEGAIQDYKQRVSRAAAASGQTSQALTKLNTQQQHNSKESTPERAAKETSSYPPRRGSKIEDRLIGFEVQSPSEECVGEKVKVDVPKIDISKRKEIFESQTTANEQTKPTSSSGNNGGVPRVTLRDRFKPQETTESAEVTLAKKDVVVKRMSGDITSIKERLQSLEQQQNLVNGANGANKTTANKLVDIPVPPLKERLSSLQNAVTKEDVRKPPVALVDARQLEIMKSEEERAKQTIKEEVNASSISTTIIESTTTTTTSQTTTKNEDSEVDRDDSGIHTADDIDVAEERLQTEHIKKEQELKLNAAIEALAMEEKQFAEAANAVNQIEAEFEELSLGSVALPPLASSTTTTINTTATTTNNNSTSAAAASTAPAAATITNDHMEYSVSSTNQNTPCLPTPPTPTTTSSMDSSNRSLLQNSAVKVSPGSNLRRKPTNEMVHAKNLLRIFKDTFQNDIELDEDEDRHEQETKTIPQAQSSMAKPLHINVKTQIFENSSTKLSNQHSPNAAQSKASSTTTPTPTPTTPLSPSMSRPSHPSPTPTTPLSPSMSRPSHPSPTPTTPLSPSMSRPSPGPTSPVSTTTIPRCVTPSGKPPMSPMSPITVRSTTKFRDDTPPGSPSANRKHDSQFSINGRVEIFNSKNMAGDNLAKSPTPTITTKITYLPHITNANAAPTPLSSSGGAATPKSSAPNHIMLPQQEQPEQQQPSSVSATAWQTANQTTSTVIEPLSTPATTIAEKKSLFEMKSMPSRQMVNEPQMTTKPTAKTANAAASTSATTVTATAATLDRRETPNPNHSKGGGAMKQQQPQTTQQPEVVVCAPPITIVNPDELPKPNTVKNLSSCFQQQHDAPAAGGKLISHKPLARSRIPQATPPQSPLTVKRNVASTTTEKSSSSPATTSSSSASSLLDEEKKLSLISSSSTSSNSTVCTVIEANKKLSTLSNSSSISSESAIIPPTMVETNAQVHKEPTKEVKSVGFATDFKESSSQTEVISKQSPDKELKSVGFSVDTKSSKVMVSSKQPEKEEKAAAVLNQKSNEAKSAGLLKQKSTEAKSSADTKSVENLELKLLLKEFLKTEIRFSETCETKPITSTPLPFESKLQPLQVVVRDSEDVKGNINAPTSPKPIKEVATPSKKGAAPPIPQTTTAQPQSPKDLTTPSTPSHSNKLPLKIDISQEMTSSHTATPQTPLSPSSQLFRTTKPLVVTTLYDKYLPEEPKTPNKIPTKTGDFQPPNNMRASISSPKTESKPTTPTIAIPAEIPLLVDCPPNESTLYKLASSAPHSPVSTTSPNTELSPSIDLDSALCNSLLTSMAATPDFVNFNRQHTVEEELCQKVDVQALPIDRQTPCTGYADISKTDIKHSEGITSKIVHKMHDAPATQRQTTVEEELCQKIDVTDLPDDRKQPKTNFKDISPAEIRKCDNLFSTNATTGNPQSPIMEARAAHSKALIETCEKIIAEEKQVNSQLKSTLPSSPPVATPILQKKSKIPKPLPSCCLATESMNEADRPELYRSTQPTTPKDDAVIARMHVVETQIKVTTTTPPASPKVANKPQPSPQMGKKTKNIFDFIKKNFGVGGGTHKEEDQVEGKSKATEQPQASDTKALVLSPKEGLEVYNRVEFDEIHNVDNSKFYLPADDVAPPPLPKTPAPVNIEITRKIITDEIVEDGKTEMELTSEIDALLDVELNKLNHEIEELDKVAKK